MSEQIREQISALLDGELPEAEQRLLLERLARDPELRERFSRYQLISDAVHQTLPARIDLELADRVMAEIDAQPAHHRQARGRTNVWAAQALKPLAGLAVAASVAVVAVMAVQQVRTPAGGPGTVQVAANPPAPLPGDRAGAGTRIVSAQSTPAGSRLQEYLVNHSEYAASGGIPGMSPYARVVGYEQK
ncbi:MAG TPA: RseA family anti-sigma factor [Gammaproteobacteria bacterium]